MIDSKSPMPWIGVYAAVASGIWTLLLFADKMHSLLHRKLWFPCRYAAFNATFLALMGIAVKLPMDLTTSMPGTYDQAAKRCSIAFLCASTAHVIPSLGSMSAREIIVNLTAVGILKVSHTVDVIFQVLSGVIEDYFQVVVVVIDVYTLFMLISSALTVSTRKMHLEHKYNALHARISAEELQRDEIMVFDKLKYHVKKYWVMAQTSDPRLVMARSDDFWVLSLIYAFIFSIDGLEVTTNNKPEIASDYKWSVYLVYYTQNSLSVAMLTSIMIALPNVQNEEKNQLLRSVIEGFKYVRPMEKSLDVHKRIVNSTSAADFAWDLVEMRHKWLDMDLQEIATISKSSKETLQNLAN
ncbi:Hypothetical predicted protein [Olea europaea subsp. europaea]|uniref:Uncharacterized protein n=1 Tax=Olea europaea subsp. europaea TaxID=158383 RepID=A0A8S0TB70_OLEEU|nr:Hypothetical predicted protein [Olea europaea subsp. europaea]